MEPKLIIGNRVYDNRGSLRFSNDFGFKNIKRFYTVHNYNKNFIRAWHGHMNEEKYISMSNNKIPNAIANEAGR